MKYSDTVNLDEAGAIVLAGVTPNQWKRVLPALAAGIKRRVARGAKLIVLNENERKIMSVATLTIKAPEEKALGHIAKGLIEKRNKVDKDLDAAVSDLAVTEDIEKVADILSSANSPVIFCSPSLFSAAKNLSLLIDIKVVAVPFEANARGAVAMGLTTERKSFKEMAEGGVDVLYAVGEVPVSGKPNAGFIIAQTSYMTGLAKEADIILPAATSLESEGTIMNYLGKVKSVNKCIEPAGDVRQHKDIIIDISKALGSPVSDADIKIVRKTRKTVFSPFEKKQGRDISPESITGCENEAIFSKSRLLWLKEAEEAAV
jgi:anaerobic selenocysteine-containing dehydrogenase